MSIYVEPAIKCYFFGKGYGDLVKFVLKVWRGNFLLARYFFSKIDTSLSWWLAGLSVVFWGGVGVSVVFFGTLLLLIVSVFHLVFLCILCLIIYIGFTFVWAIESTYLFFRKFYVVCPYCHERNSLSEYLCDKCGKIHARLFPNNYGVFYHKCVCGQKLPATFFVNRGRLQAKCPDCHQFIYRAHVEASRIFIPILGGPSSGKTAFMFAAMRQLIEEKAAKLGFKIDFIDQASKSEYNKVVFELKIGQVPGKTVVTTPKAFNIALKKRTLIKWLLYLYDPSGEAFQCTENVLTHRYQAYLTGMVLIVDPFSLPTVRRIYEQELSKTENINPSRLHVEDVLSRMILTMEESFGLSKTGKIAKPLAVVMSKVDAFNLKDLIGEPAVNKVIRKNKGFNKTEVRNNLIKQQLIEWGEAGFVQQLDARFNKVRYFSCSALGRIPDTTGRDFLPDQAIEPIVWICQSVHAKDFN